MWIKIFEIALVCVYLAFNILTAKLMSAECMKRSFIDGQCIVGKICANIFYAPAWLLKGIKTVVLMTIA